MSVLLLIIYLIENCELVAKHGCLDSLPFLDPSCLFYVDINVFLRYLNFYVILLMVGSRIPEYTLNTLLFLLCFFPSLPFQIFMYMV